MEFTALYVDIDEKVIYGKMELYKGVRGFGITEYNNGSLSSKGFKVDINSFLDVWKNEINNLLYNKTVVMFMANYEIEAIVKTFEYLITKSVPSQTENKKTEAAYPYLENYFNNNVRFDFIYLNLVLRRLFDLNSTPPLNDLNKICNAIDIDLKNTVEGKAEAVAKIFEYTLKKAEAADLMDLKHKAGITLGQIMKNTSFRVNTRNDNKVVEYDRRYVPCLPISEKEIFRTYSFV